MMKKIFLFSVVFSSLSFSQEFTKSIEDNSYFIEEAYNQEEHVVQHILNVNRLQSGKTFETSFTQEWPGFGALHQLSFTVPFQYTSVASPATQGVGDIFVHYRYQLINENSLAVAPRLSIILPTGDDTKGFGNGVIGAQVNIPVSKRFSNEFVTHYNIGGTIYPNVQFTSSKESITEYFIGTSAIYLTNSNFNIMAEFLYTSSGSTFGRTDELVVSPGVRWAIDVGELQIVPGLAFPIYFNATGREFGVFFYLSFEHPY